MTALIFLIGVILLLSGMFSGAEAALISLSPAEVLAIRERRAFGAKLLSRVHRQLNRTVITIVIWNNVVNIVGSILVGQMVIALYGNALLAIMTTALTFGIIVFSEILPKAIGMHYAERVGCYAAPLLLFLTVLMLPLIVTLEWLTGFFKKGERKVGTEAQIRSLVTLGRHAGHIESDEGQLIHRAFILNDKHARDVMTPLKDIIWVPDTATVREAAGRVFKNPYSRYPVFGASVNDVAGIVLSHDILEALTEGRDGDMVGTILREALVVDGHKRCDALMALFRDRSIHLAIVQDSEKHTLGLVTLEDVLEELVGEIEDEKDTDEK